VWARDVWKRLPVALRDALPAWVLARVLVVAGYAAARFVVDKFPNGALARGSFVTFIPWDGVQYEAIVRHGYAVDPDLYRFFPLYPLAARALDVVSPGGADLALVLLANACSLAFVLLLHVLVRRETGDRDLARRSVWFASLAPAAYVLVWGYSEALFLLLAVATFVTLRRRQFVAAAGLGALAALTRPTGLIIAIPAAIEAGRGLRGADWRGWLTRALAVVGPFVGTAGYLLWVRGETGDFFDPYSIQADRNFRGATVDPVTGVREALTQFLDHDRVGPLLHVAWAVVAIALVVVVLRTLPISYGAFAAAIVVLALSAEKLDSFERYAFAAFPLVIGAAMLVRNKKLETLVFTLSGAAMTLYTTLALLGVYLP
jgi:hypothetical protein